MRVTVIANSENKEKNIIFKAKMVSSKVQRKQQIPLPVYFAIRFYCYQ
jgi:hypothetical protein